MKASNGSANPVRYAVAACAVAAGTGAATPSSLAGMTAPAGMTLPPAASICCPTEAIRSVQHHQECGDAVLLQRLRNVGKIDAPCRQRIDDGLCRRMATGDHVRCRSLEDAPEMDKEFRDTRDGVIKVVLHP